MRNSKDCVVAPQSLGVNQSSLKPCPVFDWFSFHFVADADDTGADAGAGAVAFAAVVAVAVISFQCAEGRGQRPGERVQAQPLLRSGRHPRLRDLQPLHPRLHVRHRSVCNPFRGLFV